MILAFQENEGQLDRVIQAILRHSDIAVTQRCYIKTALPEAIAAMRQFSANISGSDEMF